MIKTLVATMEPPPRSITIGQASRKYSVSLETISRWADRGVVKVLLRNPAGRREVFLDAESLARAVEIYKKQPGRGYRPLKFLQEKTSQAS